MIKSMIWIFMLIINFNNGYLNSITKENVDDSLIKSILNMKYYQIIVFINNLSNDIIENKNILKNIVLNTPSIIIDLKKLEKTDKNQFNKVLELIYIHKKSSLIIMLQEEFQSEEIKFTLDFYVKLSHKHRRPRCLIISRDNLLPKLLIQSVLYYGWLNEFLNLSIVNLGIKENEMVFKICNYNPFFDTYNCEYYTSNVNLFPDKVTDMNGYIVKVPYINAEPYVIKNHVNDTPIFSGTGYDTLKFLESALNFRISMVNVKNTNYTYAMNSLFHGEVDMAPFPLVITDALFNNTIEIGQPVSMSKSCGLYAAMRKTSVNISITTIFPFAISIFLILIVKFVLNCMGIMKKRFGFFENIKLLLGQPVRQPEIMSERIIYYSIALISVMYSPDIIAQITGVAVAHDEQIISTYGDIIKFGLQPYTVHGFLELVIAEEDPFNDLVISKTILYSDPDTCYTLLQVTTTCICFLAGNRGKFFISRYRKHNIDILLRMSDLNFASLPDSFFYKASSPFVEKFDVINQKFLESGIMKYVFAKYLIPNIHTSSQIDTTQNVSSFQLIIIPTIGCIFALTIFIIELIIGFWKKYTLA